MDLADLDTIGACNKGAEIQLRHPVTNAPLEMFVTIAGKDSDVFREQFRDSLRDDIRHAQLAKKRGDSGADIERSERKAIELLTVCVLGWRTADKQAIIVRGEELQCTPKNAMRVLKEFPWIRDQIDVGVADLSNFIQN